MKTFVTALALGTLMTLSAGVAQAKDWSTIRIGTEGAYAPWNYTDPSGKLVGFEMDLAQDLCKRMGATKCEIIGQDWDGIIPALQQGKYDAIMASMSITDEREKVISFAGPYGSEPTNFAVLKTSPLGTLDVGVEAVDLSAEPEKAKEALAKIAALLKGKTIGVQTSTIQANFMEQLLPDVAMRTYDKLDNAGIDLANGRVDAIIGDRSAVEAVVKADSAQSMVLAGPNFSRGLLGKGVGVGLRQADADLKDKFNKAIDEATADGTIAKLSQQHFGYDISVKK